MKSLDAATREYTERRATSYVLREFPPRTATDDDRAIAYLAHKAGAEALARVHELRGKIAGMEWCIEAARRGVGWATMVVEQEKAEAELDALLKEGGE